MILEITTIMTITILLAVALIAGIGFVATQININMGPYECVDIDGNEIICEQTWRSNGVLYGITEEGKTVDLKSYQKQQKESEDTNDRLL